MPTLTVSRDELFRRLGKIYTDADFNSLCFEFGLELDEVTTQKELIERERGSGKADGASDVVQYKIDIPANRYDLLCIEGLTRGLLVFKGQQDVPKYIKGLPAVGNRQKVFITPATSQVRPHLVAAVLRDVTMTAENYRSFIDLQDKLHQNVCRKRALVAIGTHDLDTLQGPFVYDAKPPSEISFVPLGQTNNYSASQLMDLYSGESHLKQYLPIIRDKPVYPVIFDSTGVVLSMPPIINGNHSRISLDTHNILIECTATDLNRANIVLDVLVTMFGEYCRKPFHTEAVEVVKVDGSTAICPDLSYRKEVINVSRTNSQIGITMTAEEMACLLSRMCLPTHVLANRQELCVEIPPTRPDIMHACDIMEDVAIAFGYNNIPMTLPCCNTSAQQTPVNKLSDLLRQEVAACGYTEVLTFALCSRDDITVKMRRDIKALNPVHIANPKTSEFQVARTTLLPGILKTVQHNKSMPLPMKVFEISDVVLQDDVKDVRARNKRCLCVVNYNRSPGFELVHGLLDRVMQLLEVLPGDDESGYRLRSSQDAAFFPGRCADVVFCGRKIGTLGVLHPDVLTNFELGMPCAALEIDIEHFL